MNYSFRKKNKTVKYLIIWDDKDEFNNLMEKSSKKMIELVSMIETSENVKEILTKQMWSSCKACHSKFRAPH